MVRLSRIYTRTGDKGTTAIADGRRLSKADPLIRALGAVDETNACLGLVKTQPHSHQQALPRPLIDSLEAVQHDLFDVGADLAVVDKQEALRITAEHIARLENEIDERNAQLQPLTSFILPGGDPLAACLHLARCVCRRAETEIVALTPVNPLCQVYMNRLSDWLFVVIRTVESLPTLWQPGKNLPPS